MSAPLNSRAPIFVPGARQRSNAIVNGMAEGRMEQNDAVPSPTIARSPMLGEILSPRPTRKPKIGRLLAFTALPTIFDDVVLQFPPTPTESKPHNPDVNQIQSRGQPAFDPVFNASAAPPIQKCLEQHAPCLDKQNSLWARINAAEAQLGETRCQLLSTQQKFAALQKAHSALQRELEIRRNQSGHCRAPVSPPDEEAAYQ